MSTIPKVPQVDQVDGSQSQGISTQLLLAAGRQIKNDHNLQAECKGEKVLGWAGAKGNDQTSDAGLDGWDREDFTGIGRED
jgi:hypothetical protein